MTKVQTTWLAHSRASSRHMSSSSQKIFRLITEQPAKRVSISRVISVVFTSQRENKTLFQLVQNSIPKTGSTEETTPGREVRAKTTDYNWSNVPRNYTRNVDQKREKLWNFSQIKNNNVLNIASPLQTPSVFHVRPLSTRQSDDKILFSCHHRSILPFSKWTKMLHLQDSHLYSIRN